MLILDVVNEMLGTMGENRLDDINTPHHNKEDALATLARVSKGVQTRGYWFNLDTAKLSPSLVAGPTLGHITLPVGTLGVRIPRQYNWCRPPISMRAGKLFDNSNNSLVFTQDVEVLLVVEIPFENLPETVAAYIASKAVMEFQSNYDGDTQKTRELRERIEGPQGTRSMLNAEDTRETQANMIDSNSRLQYIKHITRRIARR